MLLQWLQGNSAVIEQIKFTSPNANYDVASPISIEYVQPLGKQDSTPITPEIDLYQYQQNASLVDHEFTLTNNVRILFPFIPAQSSIRVALFPSKVENASKKVMGKGAVIKLNRPSINAPRGVK